MPTLEASLTLAIRLVMVLLFLPFSALDKVWNFEGAIGQAAEVAPNRSVAVGLILCGLAVEILMPLGVLTGISDRACAFVLAGYCGVTALLWKRFWKPGDFWASASGKGRTLFWDFLKNAALGAGFLLITFGTDGSGLGAFLADPLASSHPYHKVAEQVSR
jgi:putative oxidoreductase